MLYTIEPLIPTIDPETHFPAYVGEVRRIAQLLEAQVPWHGMPHQVENDEAMIYVTTLIPLTEEQTHWFRTTPEIHTWEVQNPSGSLTLADQLPTTQTYPCCFTYEAEGRSARLDLCAGIDGVASYLHLDGGKGIKLLSDQELLTHLQHAGIPQTGWRQTIWLCYRCGKPGARNSHGMCAACETAYQAFMRAPFAPRKEGRQAPGYRGKESADAAPTCSCPLTRRELEVLAQIATGASTKGVAHTFGVSDQTIKNQLTSILSKLHVSGRTAAVVSALKQGWIPMPERVSQRERDQQSVSGSIGILDVYPENGEAIHVTSNTNL